MLISDSKRVKLTLRRINYKGRKMITSFIAGLLVGSLIVFITFEIYGVYKETE